mmetsp:Transcript_7753/g.32666  ORF Transcript_7753/g.32666 Transcript_7753/m.32666 type:complete len:269 (+) Transcript_7753:1533-2339(+)
MSRPGYGHGGLHPTPAVRLCIVHLHVHDPLGAVLAAKDIDLVAHHARRKVPPLLQHGRLGNPRVRRNIILLDESDALVAVIAADCVELGANAAEGEGRAPAGHRRAELPFVGDGVVALVHVLRVRAVPAADDVDAPVHRTEAHAVAGAVVLHGADGLPAAGERIVALAVLLPAAAIVAAHCVHEEARALPHEARVDQVEVVEELLHARHLVGVQLGKHQLTGAQVVQHVLEVVSVHVDAHAAVLVLPQRVAVRKHRRQHAARMPPQGR